MARDGYVKQVWEDGVSPVNAERMNKMEEGIEQATNMAQEALNGAGGSGGGGEFVVHMNGGYDGEPLTFDRTFAEIAEAIQSGKNVLAQDSEYQAFPIEFAYYPDDEWGYIKFLMHGNYNDNFGTSVRYAVLSNDESTEYVTYRTGYDEIYVNENGSGDAVTDAWEFRNMIKSVGNNLFVSLDSQRYGKHRLPLTSINEEYGETVFSAIVKCSDDTFRFVAVTLVNDEESENVTVHTQWRSLNF